MGFVSEFLAILQQPQVTAAIITTFVGTFFSTWMYFKGRHTEISRERLEKVYFPLFKLLDGHFFRYLADDDSFIKTIEEAKKLIYENELLAGNKLCYLLEAFLRNPDKRSYNELCNYILDEQDVLLRKNGLPSVSPYYRLDHRMFDRFGLAAFLFKYMMRFIVIPGLIGIDILAIIQVIIGIAD